MDLFRLRPRDADQAAVRDQMARDDPDYAHVRDVQHDALNVLSGTQTAHQLRDRFNEQLRESWRPKP